MAGRNAGAERLGEFVSVLIIGAGQAGLAAAYRLRQKGISFQVVEANARIGDAWRKRYSSLTLFTPRRFSALPGLELQGDGEGYASRDEFADYLERYALVHQLPISTGTTVERLSRCGEEFEALLTTGERILARNVIVATGGFQRAVVPKLSLNIAGDVQQLTAESYSEPSNVVLGTVLVVGDGASGRDIAAELAASHCVILSTGKPRRLFPERILGRSIWWWLSLVGLMDAGRDSFIGRRMRRADPFPDRDRSIASLKRRGVAVVPRLIGTTGRQAEFADGRMEAIDSVVWAVGYRDETAWLAIPGALDDQGRFVEQGGVSPVTGLYFVGRPWQRNRASALIMGVGQDAEVVAAAIAVRHRAGPGADTPSRHGIGLEVLTAQSAGRT
jgi:putative flavoprotein involved in K+ transport